MSFPISSLARATEVEDVKQIARLYSAAFDRKPKIDGLNFWVDTFEGGKSIVGIAQKFYTSPEFTEKYGELGNVDYVKQLFRNVLGREGNEDGIIFWSEHLVGGTSRAIVLAEFADSPENIAKMRETFAQMQLVGGQWVFEVDSEPMAGCLWTGPWTKENENRNYGYLDDGAVYWVAVYNRPEEGAYITLEGEFPYSRYMSFSSYRAEDASLVHSLTDRDIASKTGSVNPFVEGNPRNDPSRSYLITLEAGDPPNADAAPENTLYDGVAGAGEPVALYYRNFVPNTGADQMGDAGLPHVTLHQADGSILQGQEACSALDAGFDPTPVYGSASGYAFYRDSDDPSRATPVFRTSYTIEFILQCDFGGDCTNNPERGPGLFNNVDTDYIYSFLNRQHGEVLVLRGQIPETPETLDGGDDVFMEGQLRYWSACQYEFYSQKLEDCLYDEQIQINADGFYTIVTSRPENRPTNATAECGVGFIPWPEDGDGFGIVDGRENHPDDAWMLIRNMLPAPDFAQAIQNTSVAGDEADVLGEHLPKGQYFAKADFEGLGCNPWLALPYDGME